MKAIIAVLLARTVWNREHKFLPFLVREWDGTEEKVQACPAAPIFLVTAGRFPGIPVESLPRTMAVRYPDGLMHVMDRDHFFGLVVG